MSLINWQPEFSVGIEKIDDQHQNLIQNINDLFEAMAIGKGREVIEKILSNLSNYTREHFSDEEAYLFSEKYPNLLQHKKEHLAFIDKLKDFKQKFDDKNLTLSAEVIDFLKNWFINHICSSDKKYADFVKYKF